MSEPTTGNTPAAEMPGADEEVVPDYSRVGFKDLQRLCKARGIPGDGNTSTLIGKLQAWDDTHGTGVDLSPLDDAEPDEDEIDLLGDDDPAPEAPADGGEAASAPPSAGPAVPVVHAGQPGTPEVGVTAAGGHPTGVNIPELATAMPGAPAVTVVDGTTDGPPRAAGRRGVPNLSATTGVVSTGDTPRGPARAYRAEFMIGDHTITDEDHFRFIAETHVKAAAEGKATKGGATIGERIGFGMRNGMRTAIYQVPLRREVIS